MSEDGNSEPIMAQVVITDDGQTVLVDPVGYAVMTAVEKINCRKTVLIFDYDVVEAFSISEIIDGVVPVPAGER